MNTEARGKLWAAHHLYDPHTTRVAGTMILKLRESYGQPHHLYDLHTTRVAGTMNTEARGKLWAAPSSL